jgi:hypothetical protein
MVNQAILIYLNILPKANIIYSRIQRQQEGFNFQYCKF